MRRDPEFFGESELDLIFIAKKLKEAQAVEEVLSAAGVDYVVGSDTYRGGFIFQTERIGAFFYVLGTAGDAARGLLRQRGYKPQTLPEGE